MRLYHTLNYGSIESHGDKVNKNWFILNIIIIPILIINIQPALSKSNNKKYFYYPLTPHTETHYTTHAFFLVFPRTYGPA